MLRKMLVWCPCAVLVCALAGRAGAQEKASGAAGSQSGTTRVTVQESDELPPGFLEALAEDPERPPSLLPEPKWNDADKMTLAEVETETANLKRERSARVKAIAAFEEEMRKLQARRSEARTDKQRKQLDYEIALFRYRVATQNRAIRLISERLDALAAVRVALKGTTDVPADRSGLVSPDSVRQVREAVALLREYDQALRQILQKEPLAEEDIIYALGLLQEKEPVVLAVEAYVDDLQAYADANQPPPVAQTEATAP